MNIKVKVCGRFDLEKAVCNHGFFMMAPNRWNPSTKTLVRPLRLSNEYMINPSLVSVSVTVSISQPSPSFLSITLLDRDPILPSHRQAIVDQVKRMLRLSPKDEEHMKEFHRLHETAAKDGFGRLFRNPCLFEDIVKSWLLCCCSFKDSLAMAEGLCMVQKRLSKKRKRGRRRREEEEKEKEALGNFPSAAELAGLDKKTLLVMERNLGYRAGDILDFSKDVRDGKIDLAEFENISDGDELYFRLNRIQGIGDFVSCNILMCMGFYHRLPIDSETVRHIKQVHRKDDCKTRNAKKMVKEIYDKYAPFQTLAYWLELVEYYENHLGKLSQLDSGDYKRAAGTTINRLISS